MAADAPAIPPFLRVALQTARPLLARSLVVVPTEILAAEAARWAETLTDDERVAFYRLAQAVGAKAVLV